MKTTPPKKWRWPNIIKEDDTTQKLRQPVPPTKDKDNLLQKMKTTQPKKWKWSYPKNEDDLSQIPSEHIVFCNGAVGLCGVHN